MLLKILIPTLSMIMAEKLDSKNVTSTSMEGNDFYGAVLNPNKFAKSLQVSSETNIFHSFPSKLIRLRKRVTGAVHAHYIFSPWLHMCVSGEKALADLLPPARSGIPKSK